LIYDRADADQPHMGLTTWDKAPGGKIVSADVVIGKNYLTKAELESMGRLVNAFLDLAEDRAQQRIPMTMEDWASRLDAFMDFTGRPVLDGHGRISMEAAQDHALSEFERFRIVQDHLFVSDFDKLLADAGQAGPSDDQEASTEHSMSVDAVATGKDIENESQR
jgi:hypothetical protein